MYLQPHALSVLLRPAGVADVYYQYQGPLARGAVQRPAFRDPLYLRLQRPTHRRPLLSRRQYIRRRKSESYNNTGGVYKRALVSVYKRLQVDVYKLLNDKFWITLQGEVVIRPETCVAIRQIT